MLLKQHTPNNDTQSGRHFIIHVEWVASIRLTAVISGSSGWEESLCTRLEKEPSRETTRSLSKTSPVLVPLCTTGCGKSSQLPCNLEAASFAVNPEGLSNISITQQQFQQHTAQVTRPSCKLRTCGLLELQHRGEVLTRAPVKVLVVDDDAVAHAGEVQAVPEAVGLSLGVHLTVAAGGLRRLGPGPGERPERNTSVSALVCHTPGCWSCEREAEVVVTGSDHCTFTANSSWCSVGTTSRCCMNKRQRTFSWCSIAKHHHH